MKSVIWIKAHNLPKNTGHGIGSRIVCTGMDSGGRLFKFTLTLNKGTESLKPLLSQLSTFVNEARWKYLCTEFLQEFSVRKCTDSRDFLRRDLVICGKPGATSKFCRGIYQSFLFREIYRTLSMPESKKVLPPIVPPRGVKSALEETPLLFFGLDYRVIFYQLNMVKLK